MGADRRIGLILPPGGDPWRRFNLEQGFGQLARLLALDGFVPELLHFDATPVDWPADCLAVQVPASAVALLCGPGPAATAASLARGHELWRHVRDRAYCALLAPLRGGLLQPCLMSRSLGESLADTAMLLWADTPSAWRIDDMAADAVAAQCLDDALERGCLAMADAVFGPSDAVLAQCRSLGATPDRCILARLPCPTTAMTEPGVASHRPATAFHLGPGTRAYGADRFLDMIERPARPGRFRPGRIAFAGPWAARGPGLSLELLGLRALDWPYRLSVRSVEPRQVPALPDHPADVMAFLGPGADDEMLVETMVHRQIPTVLSADHRLAQCYPHLVVDTLEDARRARDAGQGPCVPALSADLIAAALATHTAAGTTGRRNEPARTEQTASVCIVHRDRPELLLRAIESLSASRAVIHEIIVADAGSALKRSGAVLELLERQGIRVLRLDAVGHRGACDAIAQVATGDILIFLDDDNTFHADGCARMVRALAHGPHDIVVTQLSLHDAVPPDAERPPLARQLFVGQAHAAGLLFNCLGDSSFAIRRATFDAIGRFGGYNGPANDWVFLAKAAASGLGIGVLQEAAVDYRYDASEQPNRWRKFDNETARIEILHKLYDPCHFQFMLTSGFIKKF